jgi:hypothetical protein
MEAKELPSWIGSGLARGPWTKRRSHEAFGGTRGATQRQVLRKKAAGASGGPVFGATARMTRCRQKRTHGCSESGRVRVRWGV